MPAGPPEIGWELLVAMKVHDLAGGDERGVSELRGCLRWSWSESLSQKDQMLNWDLRHFDPEGVEEKK